MNRSPCTNLLRLRFNPKTKLIEVGKADGPIAQAFDQVLTDVRRKIVPAAILGLAAKDHAAKFIAEALGFFGVGSAAKTLG